MKTKIGSSIESIERVGAKLNYTDFHDFMKLVADAFPSGTEEYEFVSTLINEKRSNLQFTKALFSLLEDKPKITDSSPYGFSWELLSPTETGKSLFKKMEELDKTSAEDLYEFMSYTYMNYTDGSIADDDDKPEEAPKEPETPTYREPDVVDASLPEEKPVPQSEEPKVPSFVAGSVEIKKCESLEDLRSVIPHGFFLNPEGFDRYTEKGPIYTITRDNGDVYAYNVQAGFVDDADTSLSEDEMASLLGPDDWKAVAAAVGITKPVASAPTKAENFRYASALMNAAKKTEKKKKAAKKACMASFNPGSVVVTSRIVEGKTEPSTATVLKTAVTESSLLVQWDNGIEEEIPMPSKIASFKDLRALKSSSVLLSSFKEVNGTTTFFVSGLKPSKVQGTLVQSFSVKTSLPTAKITEAKIPARARLYSGKQGNGLLCLLSTLEAKVESAPRFSFNKTFVSDKAATIVQSGPYGLFAVSTPVVYVKASPTYSLFKKVGAFYLNSSGNKFKAVLAARYGKPSYLMVASSAKEFFKETGAIKCNAEALLGKTQFILQRKMVRQAVIAQKAALRSAIKAKMAIESSGKANAEELENAKVTINNQKKVIEAMNTRAIAAKRTPQLPIKENAEPKTGPVPSNVDRLAKLMGAL